MPRYRICYFGSDGTGDVELVFLDNAGKDLLGKAALSIIRSRAPNAVSVEEAIQIARADQSTPPKITSIVSRKYRMVVSVTNRSFNPESAVSSYQVHRFEMLHGKHPRSSTPLGRRSGLALASPSNSTGSSALNTAGKALAEDITTDQSDSYAAITDASTIRPGTIILQTPPSVSKPPQTRGDHFNYPEGSIH